MNKDDIKKLSLRESRFVTFDRGVLISTLHQRPDRYRHLERCFGNTPRIARGGGYSYAAASFGVGVIVQQMTAFSRMLEFNAKTSTVKVEAGISLGRLIAWCQQQGLQLPPVPGHPNITVGGCIAADVHGKNPARDGTFSDWVTALTLFHPAAGFQTVTKLDSNLLFQTTCGGYGLTGIIVDATLKLTPLPSNHVVIESIPIESLEQAIEMLLMEDESLDFSYTWHDGTARGPALGKGIFYQGRWSYTPSVYGNACYKTIAQNGNSQWPVTLWNRATVPVANALFRRLELRHRQGQTKTLFNTLFPFTNYKAYHRFYGRSGLAEMQLLVPTSAIADFVQGLRKLIVSHDPALVMFSMKPFSGCQQSLSPSGNGVLFAFDLCRNTTTPAFLRAMDHLTLEVGAQPNIAKDSRLPFAIAQKALPAYDAFKGKIAQFDPDRLYQSELSQRLQL